jgi:hypothetical protein
MPEEKKTQQLLMEAAESMARAAWTMVRASAEFHVGIFGKIRDMADGALSKLAHRNDD